MKITVITFEEYQVICMIIAKCENIADAIEAVCTYVFSLQRQPVIQETNFDCQAYMAGVGWLKIE